MSKWIGKESPRDLPNPTQRPTRNQRALGVGEIVFSREGLLIGYPVLNSQPETIHTGNITQSEQAIFRNIYVYRHIHHVITINEKSS